MAIKNVVLKATKAPNQPIAPVEYDQRYQDGFSNTLRLYFNEVDNFTQAVATPLSGDTASRPIGTVFIPLPIGQFYFDTTLGLPIWWDGIQWINASGTVV
jgi:hypothetical protein